MRQCPLFAGHLMIDLLSVGLRQMGLARPGGRRFSVPRALRCVSLLLGLLMTPMVFAASTEPPLPRVLILGTGGTIAGVQDDPSDPERYRAGSLSAEDIIASVPALAEFAQIETEQFSNVPSPQIKPADWVRLSQRVSELLVERDDLAGVVITHGTDRLEETAFFLHLTVRTDKPVVLVGAQRPATHRSPDGPANLLAAVRTAAAAVSRDRGVMVVMDERILSAREVRKEYPRVGGFSEGRIGVLGHDGPEFLYRPTRPHTHRSEFLLQDDTVLPEVDLRFSYSGGVGPVYAQPPAGVVVTTTNTTCSESLALQDLARQGVAIVTAFPTGQSVRRLRAGTAEAPVWIRDNCPDVKDDPRWEGQWIWPLPAQMLTPQKARILLMLSLNQSVERDYLESVFRRY